MKKTTILICLLCTISLVQAQEFNTNQKISDQLKSGAVAGMRYAPAKARRVVADNKTNEKHDESFITQVRKGTAPGISFKAGGMAARSVTPAPATKAGPLASEAEQPKQQPLKPVAPAVIPSQEAAPAKQ